MSTLVLAGTASELTNIRAQKVIATALRASIVLSLKEATSEELQQMSILAKSLVLTCKLDNSANANRIAITGSNAMMRFISSLAPVSQLQGQSELCRGLVDGWLEFAWNSLELPLQVLSLRVKDGSKTVDAAVLKDMDAVLMTVENHLKDKEYFVGDCITLADISIAVSLRKAVSLGVNIKHTSVVRWYETIARKDFFQRTPATTTCTGTESIHIVSVKINDALDGPPMVESLHRRRRVRIKEALGGQYLNQTITVCGWARTIRSASKGKLLFVELNDGSSVSSLQCVLGSVVTANFEQCKASGGTGASFHLEGKLIASRGARQALEMQVLTGTLLGAVHGGKDGEVGGMMYPLSKKKHSVEHLRQHAHLRARGLLSAAVMRCRHAMTIATHNFFHQKGFVNCHTPILTNTGLEGADERFAVVRATDDLASASGNQQRKSSHDFFGRPVNLTTSSQFRAEALACSLSDVYTFGPNFRADDTSSSQLSEYWMVEVETAFSDVHNGIVLAEDYLKYCVKYAMDCCASELRFLEEYEGSEPGLINRLQNLLESPFKRLSYTEAIECLKKAVVEGIVGFAEEPVWGVDLAAEHERYLCEQVFQRPIVITDHPKGIKAFYMRQNNDRKTVASAHILVTKVGELVGGSERESRLDVLEERCTAMNVDPSQLSWYLDLRRYGTVPHTGFGIVFERLLLFITGLEDVRDVIACPRFAGHCDF